MWDEFAIIMKQTNHHIPVLEKAVLDLLNPEVDDRYLDLTAGFGGHAQTVISATKREDLATLVDRDETAISHLKAKFKHANIVHSDYESALKDLSHKRVNYDLILMDLGVSSVQLDVAERGFSLRQNAPLDMRMDVRQPLSAHEVVNEYDEQELADLIYEYGEEPLSRQIAHAIVSHRPVETTLELSELISATIRRRGKTHPATRTFQAIRMAVNDELGQLTRSLELLPELLSEKGRLAVISFHSLEDREVKKFFKENSRSGYEAIFTELTKKPVSGTDDVNNPRARSAKLRAVVIQQIERGLDANSGKN